MEHTIEMIGNFDKLLIVLYDNSGAVIYAKCVDFKSNGYSKIFDNKKILDICTEILGNGNCIHYDITFDEGDAHKNCDKMVSIYKEWIEILSQSNAKIQAEIEIRVLLKNSSIKNC